MGGKQRGTEETVHISKLGSGRRTLTGISVVAAAGVAAAAIGVASAGAAKNKAKSTIVIGMSASETGAYAVDGVAALEGNEYGITAINKAGGILGHKVKLDVINDQSDPTQAQLAYTKLVTQDHVNFLIGPYSPPLADAAGAIATRNHIVMLDPETAVPIIKGSRWAIQDEPGADAWMNGFPSMVRSKGYKTIALLGIDNAFGVQCVNGAKRAARKAGLRVVYSNLYSATATTMTPQAQRIKDARAQAVGSCSFFTDGVAVAKALHQVGYAPKMLSISIAPSEPTFVTSVGGLANRVISNTTWAPSLKTYGNKAFIAGFEKQFHHAPDYHAANGYASMQELAAAITKAKSLNNGAVLKALYDSHFRTVLGTGFLSRNAVIQGYPTYFYQLQRGKDVIIYPKADATGKVLTPYTGS